MTARATFQGHDASPGAGARRLIAYMACSGYPVANWIGIRAVGCNGMTIGHVGQRSDGGFDALPTRGNALGRYETGDAALRALDAHCGGGSHA